MLDEIARLGGGSDAIEVEFVEREATPEPAMRLGVRFHLAGLSLSNTVMLLDWLGVDRARSTIHNWVQKADLEPEGGNDPEKVALDETVVKVDGERFWIYAVVDPKTNRILHVRLSPTRNLGLTKRFLRQLDDKHAIEDAEFLVDGAPWLQAGLHAFGVHFRHETFGDRNPVERIFQKIKRRTYQFHNCFRKRRSEHCRIVAASAGMGTKQPNLNNAGCPTQIDGSRWLLRSFFATARKAVDMPFDMLSPEAIASGRATDAYFDRTVEALTYADRNPHVVAEVTADPFPTGEFEVLAGLEATAEVLSGLSVDVDAMAPGTLFDGGPVLRIEGPYLEFARYETAVLGFLSHASGIATAALECRRAAPESSLFSFGSRHVHPAIAPMVERGALLAGFEGFSNVAAGDALGREAGGTMPHALIICFGQGNQEAAWKAFDAAAGPDVPRIALCDTYSDEKDESVRAAEALGDALDSVRLDTTSSRRGDFQHIVREVRWELDARGYENVGIFVSGGLTPERLHELRDLVEGFGVGGHVSNADPVDFALDIVEVEGEPAAKRGKLSGAKQAYRTPGGGHEVALMDRPTPEGGEPLLEPLVRDGEVVREFDLDAATERCLADAERVLGEK